MVTICEISRIRSFCRLTLSDGKQYWIRADDLSAAGLKEGIEYENEDFFYTIRISQYPRALTHAVSMLARRPCSTKEISSRLIRLRYCEEVADLVIFKLKKEKLLNDREFCEQWIRYRLSSRTGPSVIRRELKIKGIPEDMINESFASLEPDEEYDNAFELARKAWKKHVPGEDLRSRRQKVIASLVRKGYDWDTASAASRKAEHEKYPD